MIKKLLLGLVVTIGLVVCAGTAQSQDRLAWFNDLDYNEQSARLDAMETVKEMTFSATDDNFGKYLRRWAKQTGSSLNPKKKKEKKNKKVSCFTGADTLMEELKADPVISAEFDMKLYNTGVNVYGRSIPVPHFTIRLDPKNGIGPSLMADRYLGGFVSEIVEWEEADLTTYVIEVYAKTYPITDSDFELMSSMIVEPPPVVEEPLYSEREWLIIEALEFGIGLPCESSSLFSGQPKYCPTHDKPRGPHCTIGAAKWCPYHGGLGLEHDIGEFFPEYKGD